MSGCTGRAPKVEKLSPDALKCPDLAAKVNKMLKVVNATRCSPLQLVEVVSGEIQFDQEGVKTSLQLQLREAGNEDILKYSLDIFKKDGTKKVDEFELTLQGCQ